jgi:TonB family protein
MRSEKTLNYSFGLSLALHAGLVVAVSLWMVSISPVDLSVKNYIELTIEKPEKPPAEKVAPSPREVKVARKEITPPKLIDKPDQLTLPTHVESSPRDEVEDLEKSLPRLPGDLKVEQGTPFVFIPPSPDPLQDKKLAGFGPSEIKAFGQPLAGESASQASRGQSTAGSEAGAGVLSAGGDLAVIPGGGTQGGGGGTAERGLGMGDRGLSTLTPGGGGMPDSKTTHSTAGVFSSTRPIGIRKVIPSYPRSARLAGIEGVSLLKVEVLTDGGVGRILIEKSSGNLDLDRAAKAAISQWHFAPARHGEKRIKAWVIIPIRFRLSGG